MCLTRRNSIAAPVIAVDSTTQGLILGHGGSPRSYSADSGNAIPSVGGAMCAAALAPHSLAHFVDQRLAVAFHHCQ